LAELVLNLYHEGIVTEDAKSELGTNYSTPVSNKLLRIENLNIVFLFPNLNKLLAAEKVMTEHNFN
jgi:hypothetical protein